MKFCKQCGAEVDSNEQTCTSCGEPMKPSSSPKSSALTLSKKQKGLLIAGVVFIFLAVIGYQAGAHMFDQERVVEQFEQALIERDVDTLGDMVSSQDPRLDVDATSVQSIVDYLHDHPSYFEEVLYSLYDQVERDAVMASLDEEEWTEPGAEEAFAVVSEQEGMFTLQEDGRKFLFFPDYTFAVRPYYIEIMTNEADAALTINGEEVGVTEQEHESQEFGPFVPGVYTVGVHVQHEYVTLEEEMEINLIGDGQNRFYVDLPLQGEYIYIDTNHPEAELYVNHEPVGLTVGEAAEFGPVTTDGSITVHAQTEFPWGPPKVSP